MALIEKQFSLKISEKPQEELVERGVNPPDDETLELDLIERLRSNISKLNDLQLRLGFMNSELESVLGMDTQNQ